MKWPWGKYILFWICAIGYLITCFLLINILPMPLGWLATALIALVAVTISIRSGKNKETL